MPDALRRKRLAAAKKACRDYAKEYREYHSKREQKDNRNACNKARRKKGLARGDSREVDHKTPQSKGGGNSGENLRVVSRTTNRKKYDRVA
jgi:5-methylcytosine-specific restriction endonuclease McrA